MRFITLKERKKKKKNYSKCSVFTFVAAFALIFHVKLCSFRWRVAQV